MDNLTAIDLFSGPGGLSEGFSRAGYDIVLGLDNDGNSAETFTANHEDSEFICEDVGTVDADTILAEADIRADQLDIIIGGPPCQGFSIAGDREKDDERNQLFKEFARLVSELQPNYLLMENVPGMLSMETTEGNPVVDEIQSRLSEIGYRTTYDILRASNYGVPQDRRRVFILGSRDSTLELPDRTHITSGQNAKIGESDKKLRSSVTVREALSDLPQLDAGESAQSYNTDPKNEYQKQLRTESGYLPNHEAVNHKERIVKRFSHIPQGGDMRDAPDEYQPSKIYSSRNRRLIEDKPSYTVTSHVLDELIHPWDDRSVTVREAARLQSFPDSYQFYGKRNVFHGADETSQYEQVGNAVPVLLSKAIANSIKQQVV